jgi:hypothetical protein
MLLRYVKEIMSKDTAVSTAATTTTTVKV